MERKVREGKVLVKKKNVAFKSTPILLDNNEDIDNEKDNDKDLSLLVKNVRKMLHKRGWFNTYRKIRRQGKGREKVMI